MTVDGLVDMWADYVIGNYPTTPLANAVSTSITPLLLLQPSIQTHLLHDICRYYTANFSQNGIPYPNLNFSHRICRHLSSFRHCLAPHQAGQFPQLLDRFVQGWARPWSFPRHRYRQMDFQGWNGVGGQAGGSFRMFPLHNVCPPKDRKHDLLSGVNLNAQAIDHYITYSVISAKPQLSYSSVVSTIRLFPITSGHHEGQTFIQWSGNFSSDADAGMLAFSLRWHLEENS